MLPTFEERENLAALLPRLFALPLDLEVIVVDDASPDRTADVVRTYPSFGERLFLVERPAKLGLASALLDGFREARSGVLAVMDADQSHDPSILPALVRAIEGGADVAIGSRFVTGGGIVGWPIRRQLASLVATWLARILLHVRARDPMSGYFALSRATFERVSNHLRPRGYKLLLEVLVRAAPLRVVEIGFVFVDRVYGKSKLSSTIAREYVRMVWELLWRR